MSPDPFVGPLGTRLVGSRHKTISIVPRVHKNRRLASVRVCNSNRRPQSGRNFPPVLKIELWSRACLATLTFYTACTVRVTIFSTGGKFRPVARFLRSYIHSYSSRPFLYALGVQNAFQPITTLISWSVLMHGILWWWLVRLLGGDEGREFIVIIIVLLH